MKSFLSDALLKLVNPKQKGIRIHGAGRVEEVFREVFS